MVGAYEAVIENLCTSADGIRPKIVASTATISRADQQIRNLYGRNEVCLFPPVGLDAADSFFAKQARFRDGSLQPGRLYVGVLAPGHGSLQTTQVRCFASLMQGAASVGDTADKVDPWWTLLVFSTLSVSSAEQRRCLLPTSENICVSFNHVVVVILRVPVS